MRTVIPFLTLIVLTSLEVQAGDYPATTDFFQLDYTYLIIAPASTNWASIKTVPFTNWPAANPSEILSPPTGLRVQASN
jgi:hypothetical protein